MSGKATRDVTPNAANIIKALEPLAHSRYNRRVFEDFVLLAEIVLERLPYTAGAILTGEQSDDGERAGEYQALVRGYKPAELDCFAQAFGLLLRSAQSDGYDGDYDDLLGDVYMAWANPKPAAGQYFTPMPLCKAMAQMVMGDIEPLCRERVAAAIDAGPWGQMGFARGNRLAEPGREGAMLHALAAAYEHLKPVDVCDCACGSGAMLLAAASACPRWAVSYGVVRFWGQDIDLACARMARVQLMLYGLNGYRLKLAAALHTQQAPQPVRWVAAPLAPPVAQPDITLPVASGMQISMFG